MNDDKIIQFPGAAGGANSASGLNNHMPPPATDMPPGLEGLNEDQRKALQVVLSGMTFVMVGIKPTERGADFYTAISGDEADLRNAADHLSGVIERAYDRKGI